MKKNPAEKKAKSETERCRTAWVGPVGLGIVLGLIGLALFFQGQSGQQRRKARMRVTPNAMMTAATSNAEVWNTGASAGTDSNSIVF
jgi:hypothetical protein